MVTAPDEPKGADVGPEPKPKTRKVKPLLITKETKLKFLTDSHTGQYSKFDYTSYLPSPNRPGKWLPKLAEEIVLCGVGYHYSTAEHVLTWANSSAYVVDTRGAVVVGDNKYAAAEMRLVRQIPHWTKATIALWACDCAERVLPLAENPRSLHAVAVARRFLRGSSSEQEMAAAWDAAREAARAAARAAAWAAMAAAWAARAAAMAAAAEAARDAARDAAWEAARDAAMAAAAEAARDAARDAAWEAEVTWQQERMLAYMNGLIDPNESVR